MLFRSGQDGTRIEHGPHQLEIRRVQYQHTDAGRDIQENCFSADFSAFFLKEAIPIGKNVRKSWSGSSVVSDRNASTVWSLTGSSSERNGLDG